MSLARLVTEMREQVQQEHATTLQEVNYFPNAALERSANEFIASKQKILLIQGSAGSGKTLLLHSLVLNFLKDATHQATLPIYISLHTITKQDPSQILQTELQRFHFSADEIAELKLNHKFLFILDGFEDLAIFQNIWLHFGFNHWSAQIIVSCRPEYFINTDDYQCFFRYIDPLTTQVNTNLLREETIEGLTEQQIPQLQTCLQQLPWLINPLRNPLILSITSPLLTNLSKREEKMDEATQSSIAKAILDGWFTYHETKLVRQKLLPGRDPVFIKQMWDYSCSVAKQMKQWSITQITYQPSSALFDETNEWDTFFSSNDPRITLLHSTCPLLKIGRSRYAFPCTQILDYLATQSHSLTMSANPQQSIIAKPAPHKERPAHFELNTRLIVREIGVISRAAEFVLQSEDYKAELFSIVLSSKNNPHMAIAAANAITILNKARVSFSNYDLRGIQVPFANLEGAMLYNTDLSDADLTAVNLSQAMLDGANLSNTTLKGTIFGEQRKIIVGSDEPIKSIAYSEDGTLCAVGTGRGYIHMYNTAHYQELYVIRATPGGISGGRWLGDWINCLVFSRDGRLVFSGEGFTQSGRVCVWNSQSGERVNVLMGHNRDINAMCIHPSNPNLLVTASDDHTICVWDIPNGKLNRVLRGHTGAVTALCFDKTGNVLYSGSSDDTFKTWDISTGKCINSFDTPDKEGVMGIAITQQDSLLIVVTRTAINFWDIKNHRLIETLSETHVPFKAVLSPSGRYLATFSMGSVNIWDIEQRTLHSTKAVSPSPFSLAFYPQRKPTDNTLLAIGTADVVQLEEVIPQTQLVAKKGHTSYIDSTAYSKKHRLLISTSMDGTLLWDMNNKNIRATLSEGKGGTKCTCTINQDETLAAIATGHGNPILILDLLSQRILQRLEGQHSNVSSLIFTRASDVLISSSWDQTVCFWNVKSGDLLDQLQFKSMFSCKSLALHPSEKYLAIGHAGSISIYNISGPVKHEVDTLVGHKDWITCLKFHPNGNLLISGGFNNKVCYWDVTDPAGGKLIYSMTEHSSRVQGLDLSPSGKYLASCGDDRTVVIWDIQKRRNICQVFAHPDRVMSVTFLDERHFITASWDSTLRLWQLDTLPNDEKLIARLQWVSNPGMISCHDTDFSEAKYLPIETLQILYINRAQLDPFQIQSLRHSQTRTGFLVKGKELHGFPLRQREEAEEEVASGSSSALSPLARMGISNQLSSASAVDDEEDNTDEIKRIQNKIADLDTENGVLQLAINSAAKGQHSPELDGEIGKNLLKKEALEAQLASFQPKVAPR